MISKLTITKVVMVLAAVFLVGVTPASAEHPNELALIIAGTYKKEETSFTTGLEFGRRLTHRLGVGGAVEYLADGTWLFAFPVYFHPVGGGGKVFTGPGVERDDGENSFLWRVGAAYSFEFAERYSVTPGLAVDFVGRQEAQVFGANFGFSF